MDPGHTAKYPLFVHYYGAYQWMLDTCQRLPRSLKFTLGDRIVQLATQILEWPVEAIYTHERTHILLRMNLAYEKLRIFFRILHDRRHISVQQYAHISELINTCGQMTGGWIKSCNA